MARQCLRCSCLPGWHGGQRLWGLLLRHGWVLRTGSGTQAFRATSPSPSHHTPWACSRAVRGAAAGGLTRGCPTRVSHPGALPPPRPAASDAERLLPRAGLTLPALT